MRGGFIHNRVLVKPLAEMLKDGGASVWCEYPVGPGSAGGYVDIYAQYSGFRLAIEAERTPARIGRDLLKAKCLSLDLLMIVVPNQRIAAAVWRQLHRIEGESGLGNIDIEVLPFGLAVKRLRELMSINVSSQCLGDINTKKT